MAKTLNWLSAHASHTGDACLIWPFARNKAGYGNLRVNKQYKNAHRVMCEMAHGPAGDQQIALHSCGNGHAGCVNPKHLRWGTPKENTADALAAGTFARGERARKSLLIERDVLQMRAARSAGQTYQRIADDYGVTIGAAHLIVNRKVWSHVA
jgi:hypothetical protein